MIRAAPFIFRDGVYCPCTPAEASHVQIHLHGPFPNRMIPVQINGTRRGTGNWTWNGDIENPTLKPSILTQGSYFDDQFQPVMAVCHTWITDGKVQYLNDSTHEFSGKTLEMMEVDHSFELEGEEE